MSDTTPGPSDVRRAAEGKAEERNLEETKSDPDGSDATASTPEAENKPVEPPYSIYTRTELWFIVIMAMVGATFSPLTANVYFPAIPTIANAFHQSIEKINLTVTVYMVGQGVAPSFWSIVADRKGRRLSFLLCLLLLVLASVGLALVPTSAYWLLVVLRFIQAAGSASTVALAYGVIADVTTREERGIFVGIAGVGPMIGPCIGPVIGGLLADKLGWRSIFWFLAIVTGSCFIVMLLFFPETLRCLVGNGSIPPSKWNRALIPIIGCSSLDMNSTRPPFKPLPNPFKLFKQPDLIIILFSGGICVAGYYAISATISSLFAVNYPFLNETEIGLCFLASGAGGVAGTITAGKLLDVQFQRIKRRYEETRKGDAEKRGETAEMRDSFNDDDFPIEKARLMSQQILIGIFAVCCIGYGWSLQSKTSIAVPLILQFIIGYCMIAIANNTSTLLIDLFPTQSSSASAAFNLVRASLGAVATSVISLITDAVKPGWAYTIVGVVCALGCPLILIELKMGPKWRKKRTQGSSQA